MSWATDWVERNTGHQLTPDEARCVDVLCSICAVYNLPLIGRWTDARKYDIANDEWTDDDQPPARPPVEFAGRFIIARLNGELATYDGNALTSLVLAAHERAVRVSVSSELYTATDSVRSCLTLHLHPRAPMTAPGMRLWSRHPSIEQALAERAGMPR